MDFKNSKAEKSTITRDTVDLEASTGIIDARIAQPHFIRFISI